MRYEESHPWLTFNYSPSVNVLWAKLGEAFSKNQHLAGIPLPPRLAEELAAVVLTKGALATTAIEGNTLSEREASEIIHDGKKLPPSQEYLETEIRNIVAALNDIHSSTERGFLLSPEWIREQNRKVLSDLEVEAHVTPGEYTSATLVVGQVYRGAPPEDLDFLMRKMCGWLNEAFIKPAQDETSPLDLRFYNAMFAALLAHLYFVWVHPFGDGNGRTARLIEVAILLSSGVVPWIAANLLSDHYNRTRTRYYTRLDAASRRGEVDQFIEYAVAGYVDMIREQIDTVKQHQVQIAWTNYVHEQLHHEPAGPAKSRRLELVLALPSKQALRKQEIRYLTPKLTEHYAGHEDRMIQRDLNALKKLGLVAYTGSGYMARQSIMNAFMPLPGS